MQKQQNVMRNTSKAVRVPFVSSASHLLCQTTPSDRISITCVSVRNTASKSPCARCTSRAATMAMAVQTCEAKPDKGMFADIEESTVQGCK